MERSRWRMLLAALLGAAAIAAAGSIAWATVPDGGGVIHGCYHEHSGELRLVDPDAGDDCRHSELPVSWNQRGPAGPPGETGPQGPRGDPGEQALAGQRCSEGAFVTGFDEDGAIACRRLDGIELVITPAAHDFGTVEVGLDREVELTVESAGSGTATVRAVELTSETELPGEHEDFVLVLDECTGVGLTPGARCTLFVLFAPGSSGPKTATVAVIGSAGATISATLSGRGA